MPHWNHATIIVAVGLSAAAAPIPATGQMLLPGDPTTRLGRPLAPTPRFEEPRRDYSPSPSPWSATPWSAAPTSRPGSSLGITQRQAMDILDAAGFTNVAPPEPNLRDGSWTAYAAWRGRVVRATVDQQGNISTR